MEQVIGDRDAFAERLFGSMLGAVDMLTVYMGDRLGLYEHLRKLGSATSTELAEAADTDERYTREWLEQQAVSGVLEVADQDAPAADRRFSLPMGHAEVLLDRDSLAYLAPLGRMLTGTTRVMPQLLDAFRDGGGVDWELLGPDGYEGQAAQNRPVFLQLLGQEWLPAIPGVHERLSADPPARVLDVGCGGGWAAIGMATAYPKIEVDGVDLDAPAIELARRNVADVGLTDRVRFINGDAAALASNDRYDLVTMLEMVHDMSFPVRVLTSVRERLNDGGSVVVMDERVGLRFEAPGDDLERFDYGFSVLSWLPSAMIEDGAAGTGTVMRPDTLHGYAKEAGFGSFEILPIDHDFFRFYRLGP